MAPTSIDKAIAVLETTRTQIDAITLDIARLDDDPWLYGDSARSPVIIALENYRRAIEPAIFAMIDAKNQAMEDGF